MFWFGGVFLFLLGLHWFGDFVLQTHWQATNKSKNVWALAAHVGVYTLVMTVGFGCIMAGVVVGHPLVGWLRGFVAMAAFASVTFLTHFLTDAVTSRISSRRFGAALDALLAKQDAGQRWHDFFEVIGADQLVHQVTLFLTLVAIFWPIHV